MHGYMSSIRDFAPLVACLVSSWTRSSPLFKANIMPILDELAFIIYNFNDTRDEFLQTIGHHH